MLDVNFLNLITKEHVYWDKCGNTDSQTIGYYILLPEEIQKEYEKYLKNEDGTIENKKYIEAVWCEYWIDENSFHWELHFDGDSINVNDDFKCKYIENMLLERYKKEGLM